MNRASTRVESKWSVTPLMDVYENDDEYLLVGDLPGIDRSQLDLRVEKGVLVLESSGADEQWEYRREFRVGDDVDLDGSTARLDAGVLQLHLPKRAEVKPRKIAVTSA